MSISNIKEIKNIFGSIGPQGPPNCTAFTSARCFGDFNLSDPKQDIKFGVGNTGGVWAQISKAKAGLGDGMSPTPGGRDKTQNALAGSGDTSVRTITRICNPDGTGFTADSGGGAKNTFLISTGDGGSGALFTKDFVALFCDGVELILHGKEKKITFTYALIQETLQGPKGSMAVKTFRQSHGLTDA